MLIFTTCLHVYLYYMFTCLSPSPAGINRRTCCHVTRILDHLTYKENTFKADQHSKINIVFSFCGMVTYLFYNVNVARCKLLMH
jgi:hypothetical protein